MQCTSRYGKKNETCHVLHVTYMVLRVLAIGADCGDPPGMFIYRPLIEA